MNSYDDHENNKSHGLFWLSVWLFVLFWFFLPPKIQTVTVYRLGCPEFTATGAKCGQAAVPTRSTYKVFIEQQFVVARDTMKTYDDCDVYDRKNWECHTPQLLISMHNGHQSFQAQQAGYNSSETYNEAVESLKNEETRNPQVPVWTWASSEISSLISSNRFLNGKQPNGKK